MAFHRQVGEIPPKRHTQFRRPDGGLCFVELTGEMYRTPAQQLVHMTVDGASPRTGDLYASGTVSGPRRDQRGSVIELSRGGEEPVVLPDGSTRTSLGDGDVLTLTASAPGADGHRSSLGGVTGRVDPAPTP